MRERLAKGGEIAQGVVRELFPAGIWLSPDPNGGRFHWANARTAILHPAGLVDTEGRLLAEGFPRVYNAVVEKVAGSGSGGVICAVPSVPQSARVK